MNNNCLIIFTAEYPFGIGETYIETEIQYLSAVFSKIFIIPRDCKSHQTRAIPNNASVFRFEERLTLLERICALRLLFLPIFWQELINIKSIFSLNMTVPIFKELLAALAIRSKVCGFLRWFIKKEHIPVNSLYLYSYWMDYAALGAAFFKEQESNIVFISRAHGWDLYFERNLSNYLSFRRYILDQSNAIFFVSENGKEYFLSKNKIPIEKQGKLLVSKLGVKNKLTASQSLYNRQANELRILSCSSIVEIKRLELIISALSMIDSIHIEWFHIGCGKNVDYVRGINAFAEGKLSLKANVKFNFFGEMNSQEIFKFYQTHELDCFINLSLSEGLPVSIMEAMSFGVPVIATNVGGISEVVNDKNGILLSANPMVEEVCNALLEFNKKDLTSLKEMRKAALNTWYNKYNAEINYSEFLKMLFGLSNLSRG